MPKRSFYLLWFVVLGLMVANQARAVPPPDFIFNVGSQMAQFFSIAVLFLGAILSSIYQFVRVQLVDASRRRVFIGVSAAVVVLVAGGGTWMYGRMSQQNALRQWLVMSERYKGVKSEQETIENSVSNDGDDQAMSAPVARGSDEVDDELDQLRVDGNKRVNTSPPLQGGEDSVAEFIRRYYRLIGSRQLDEAYQLSKKSVSLSTFKSWYAQMNAVMIDKLQRIDQKRSSLELTLEENGTKTRYGVLMDVVLEGEKPVRIGQSTVRVLSLAAAPVSIPETKSRASSSVSSQAAYFDQNKNRIPLAVSNEAFQAMLDRGERPYIIDAREDVEYENGHFPGGVHIRFADLKAGRWIELPQDRPVYIFCWSGIRGKEVAEFLRKKKILASYLDHGANGWVFFGGKWEGNINFVQKYTDPKYQNTFTTDQVRRKIQEGVVLVDSRSPGAYKKWHVPGSFSLSLISTPTIALPAAYVHIPSRSKVISICDDYVNCFDAKLIGVELERRGHTFLGRYNRPWEMR